MVVVIVRKTDVDVGQLSLEDLESMACVLCQANYRQNLAQMIQNYKKRMETYEGREPSAHLSSDLDNHLHWD